MKIFVIIFLVNILFARGCVMDRKYGLTIKNHGNHAVHFYVGGVNLGSVYPDTSLLSALPAMQQILPGQMSSWSISYPFEDYFKELPRDTLSIFLFHPDTLRRYDWSLIRNQYKVSKRYDLSLQDLQGSNYTVTFP